MFREMLLATTALLAVASITSAEARSAGSVNAERMAARQLASAVAHRGQDKNSEFLCTYGGYDVYDEQYSSSTYQNSGWKHVAVPIRGRGLVVDKIVVENSASQNSRSTFFSVGIYSNTPSGIPGQLIVGATKRAKPSCESRDVHIHKTVLRNGKKYWIEETVAGPGWGRNDVSWAIDPVARENAYSQYHVYSGYQGKSEYSYTSPWTPISGRAPFVRVK